MPGGSALSTNHRRGRNVLAKITIIGTGLIGTSLALALKQANLRNVEIVGTDSDSRSRAGAQKSGGFDRVENRLLNALRDVDIVVLATPVMAMKELMEIIGPELPNGCLVTDVGSSKRVVMDWAGRVPAAGHRFRRRASHGGEGDARPGERRRQPVPRQGLLRNTQGRRRASRPYQRWLRWCRPSAPRPFYIGVDEHDSFVAAVSHLPFMLSVGLVGCTSKSANWEDIAQLASSGYHDLTRLASGDPIMHRDICATNSQHIVAWIDAFIRELYHIRQSLDTQTKEDTQELQRSIQVLADQALSKPSMESDVEGLQKPV